MVETKYVTSEGKREPRYKIEEIWVDKDTMDKFTLMDNRRRIRSTQVNSLLTDLIMGKHFESPMVVNKLEDLYRIIDGNHRFEALIAFFTGRPKMKVKLKLAVYENLTPAEEKEVYTTWSLGIKQTVDDLLNLVRDDIPFFKYLEDAEVPVSTYREARTDKLHFKLYIHMVYSSYNAKNGIFTPSTPGRNHVVDAAKAYTEDQAKELKEFIDLFTDIFGGLRSNYFSKSVFIIPLFNLYHLNRDFAVEDLKERFKKCLAYPKIIDMLRGHSKENKLLLRDLMLQIMNEAQEHKLEGTLKNVRRLTEGEKKFMRAWNRQAEPEQLRDREFGEELGMNRSLVGKIRKQLEEKGYIEVVRFKEQRSGDDDLTANERKFLELWGDNKEFKELILENERAPKGRKRGMAKAGKIMGVSRKVVYFAKKNLEKKGLIKIEL